MMPPGQWKKSEWYKNINSWNRFESSLHRGEIKETEMSE